MVHHRGKSGRLADYGKVVEADLSDQGALRKLCRGIDTVVHLAGNPDPSAEWEELLPANILGTYNIFAAAHAAGCRRVVFASSIHAVMGYAPDVQVKTDDPVNPADIYGVTKCFGEALGRYFAEQEGLSVIAIRIGAFQKKSVARREDSLPMVNSFVSHRDLADLMGRCVDDEMIKFAIFHGLSNDRFKRLDISDAREFLKYAPRDDYAREHPRLKRIRFPKTY